MPFLRGIEVQVLDHGYAEQYEKQNGKKSDWFTTHGDVFPIHGATMKPFGRHNGRTQLSLRGAQQGDARSGTTTASLAPTASSASASTARKSPAARTATTAKAISRSNPRARRSSSATFASRSCRRAIPPPSLVAPEDTGLRPIFTGLDLRGWKTNAATAQRWDVRGERLSLRGGTVNPDATLWSEKDYAEGEFIFDCRPAKPGAGNPMISPAVVVRGVVVKLTDALPGKYQRYSLSVKGPDLIVKCGDKESQRLTLPDGAQARGALGLCDTGSPVEWMNLYARER